MDKEINTGVVLPIVGTLPKISYGYRGGTGFFYVDLSPCGYAIVKDVYMIQTKCMILDGKGR